jgi:serine/threonine protein kinase
MGVELAMPAAIGERQRCPEDQVEPVGPAAALLGRLLCRKWRIDGLVSAGGTSWVYSATHRNGRRVAIKVLRRELASVARIKKRFLREGYLANRVGHPGAVCVLDDDTDDGVVFLVMEFLEGTNLKTMSREGPREPQEVAFVVDGLLDILAAAHGVGVVHRDVKPSNIFLTTTGEIKLLDFGIARLRDPSSALSHTRNGQVLGTPGFMAPEQARGRWGDVDARTDIWAVGATMFRLLTGRHVHEADSDQEAMIAAATTPAPLLGTARGDVPDSLGELVDRALRFDARERWQSAREMQSALRAVRSELPPYAWQGVSLADDTGLGQTLDVPESATTTSSFEGSRQTGRRAGARPGRWPRVITPLLVALVVTPLVIEVRSRPDPAPEGQSATPGRAAPVRGATDPGVEGPGAKTSTGAVAVLATGEPSTREVPATVDRPPAARARSPRAMPLRTSAIVPGAVPGPTPAPTTTPAPSTGAPVRLEEFLNDRR